MQETGSKISVRIASQGYLYSYSGARSEWLGAACIFSTSEFQRKYDHVEISVFNPVFALVPEHFFNEEKAADILADIAGEVKRAKVAYKSIPEFGAVAIYSMETGENMSRVISDLVRLTDGSRAEPLPEQYHILKSMGNISEYNKVVASYADGRLYLAVGQGRSLLLCNSYPAEDFTTAQYYIFSALKRFQMNPEITGIWMRTPLSVEDEQSLYNYFKQVERI